METVTTIDFWYECNASWGPVKDLEALKHHFERQQTSAGSCRTFDDFLDRSKTCTDNRPTQFGTRREHRGELTLRKHLTDNGLLEEFTEMCE